MFFGKKIKLAILETGDFTFTSQNKSHTFTYMCVKGFIWAFEKFYIFV